MTLGSIIMNPFSQKNFLSPSTPSQPRKRNLCTGAWRRGACRQAEMCIRDSLKIVYYTHASSQSHDLRLHHNEPILTKKLPQPLNSVSAKKTQPLHWRLAARSLPPGGDVYKRQPQDRFQFIGSQSHDLRLHHNEPILTKKLPQPLNSVSAKKTQPLHWRLAARSLPPGGDVYKRQPQDRFQFIGSQSHDLRLHHNEPILTKKLPQPLNSVSAKKTQPLHWRLAARSLPPGGDVYKRQPQDRFQFIGSQSHDLRLHHNEPILTKKLPQPLNSVSAKKTQPLHWRLAARSLPPGGDVYKRQPQDPPQLRLSQENATSALAPGGAELAARRRCV
ncbi:hypothetical protein DEO72_LG2g2799 [Vigna unguiculata]|uniref:Uncharacterized protein n=1 Tax=Vigna unguiculata TaxID=3917 RepID=A0A4D6L1S8_VIGUN|nr:hypothetical protein DEO72_LG2g2799 [Vigna unguiculata]